VAAEFLHLLQFPLRLLEHAEMDRAVTAFARMVNAALMVWHFIRSLLQYTNDSDRNTPFTNWWFGHG
jgi:hypothetical protein